MRHARLSRGWSLAAASALMLALAVALSFLLHAAGERGLAIVYSSILGLISGAMGFDAAKEIGWEWDNRRREAEWEAGREERAKRDLERRKARAKANLSAARLRNQIERAERIRRFAAELERKA